MKIVLGLALTSIALGALLVGCDGGTSCADCAEPQGGSGASGAGTGQTGTATGTGTSSGTGQGGEGGSTIPPEEWTTLISGEWALEPGSELTSDIHTLTLDHDIYIGAIRPIAPTGTHHTVLAVNGLGASNTIYASGVGTNAIIFPDGVGLKVAAGQTLILQLHLFNVAAQPISGVSGIEIVEVAPEDVEFQADILLPGPLNLSIPPNQQSTQAHTCTLGATQKFFAVFPHMHQLGSHFKTTLVVGGQEQVLHDDEYVFDHQAFIPFEPLEMNPGDSIKTECTWNNTTSQTVTWGESSTSEMCFSILYRYPAQTDGGLCGG
jgi:hypothetical protein